MPVASAKIPVARKLDKNAEKIAVCSQMFPAVISAPSIMTRLNTVAQTKATVENTPMKILNARFTLSPFFDADFVADQHKSLAKHVLTLALADAPIRVTPPVTFD